MSGHARHLHAVPTLDPLLDLEERLRTAIDRGAQDLIEQLGGQLDHHEATNTRPAPDMLAAALWYASHGLKVFPLQPHDAVAVDKDTGEITSAAKRPYPGTRGCKDATNNPNQIRAWWTARPHANIGIATGHLYDVVDIDGPTGQATRARMWKDFTDLRIVARVLTPRPGGMHLYVPATGLGNKVKLYPGIDYRGAGGYVVAPPSRISPPGDHPGEYRLLALDTTKIRRH